MRGDSLVMPRAQAETSDGNGKYCLVVDTIGIAGVQFDLDMMDKFLKVAFKCESVICARVSPDQKGEIIRVKNK